MLARILFLIFFLFSTFLYGVPSLEDLKEQIKANPELLDTPEAQKAMQERGLTKEQIEAKLQQEKKITYETIGAEDITNQIDIMDENLTDKNETQVMDENLTQDGVKRLNPFVYQTNLEVLERLEAQKQLLVDKKLTRYSESFYANKNRIDSSSLPTPDDYTLSSSDVISIHIYGDRDKEYELEVQNDGTVDMEFIGPVRIGGLHFSDAKELLKSKLSHHFKRSSFKISISKYSTIQVTLIGDVKYPGIYNLSSFASVKDLLVEAKGIRPSASVRNIDIKRNGKSVAKLDFYDLLFGGKSIASTLLKHGDIVLIKKAKKLVSIDGYVNHAAIFELTEKESLKDLIEYAGGMSANASKRHIKIERYSDNTLIETFHIPYRKAKNFFMKDGDKVHIYKLDSANETNVNIYGNIIRPGSYPLNKETKTLNQLLKEQLSFGLKNFFLPETYFEYGMIKRYSNSLEYEIKSFHLAKVIEGKEKVELYPKDEIYIFSKNDIRSTSYITTKGDILLNAGKFRYFQGMSIQDALNASGIDGIVDEKIKVTTISTPNRMPKTIFYNYKDASTIQLHPYDTVEVFDYYKTHLLQPVSIKGEVIAPTTVFYEKGMQLRDLFDAAGGLTPEAYKNKVEIVRYYLDEDNERRKKMIYLDLREQDSESFPLTPYDEVSIYKIPNWGEKRVITLQGEVRFPGTYTVSAGEHLSSVIERAGGYTEEAFLEGAVFTRESIRKQQVKQYNRELARIKRQLAIYNAMPANAKKAALNTNATNTLNEVIAEAAKYQPMGRVSIHLQRDLDEFKRGEYDLILKDQDTLTIPSQIDTVTVFGEVFNATSFLYNSEYEAEDYIAMVGGSLRSADEDNIYIIHADGISEPLDRGWFSSKVKIAKGDTIVVPLYIKETNQLEIWESISRIMASFAVTAATLQTLGVF